MMPAAEEQAFPLLKGLWANMAEGVTAAQYHLVQQGNREPRFAQQASP